MAEPVDEEDLRSGAEDGDGLLGVDLVDSAVRLTVVGQPLLISVPVSVEHAALAPVP